MLLQLKIDSSAVTNNEICILQLLINDWGGSVKVVNILLSNEMLKIIAKLSFWVVILFRFMCVQRLKVAR